MRFNVFMSVQDANLVVPEEFKTKVFLGNFLGSKNAEEWTEHFASGKDGAVVAIEKSLRYYYAELGYNVLITYMKELEV